MNVLALGFATKDSHGNLLEVYYSKVHHNPNSKLIGKFFFSANLRGTSLYRPLSKPEAQELFPDAEPN